MEFVENGVRKKCINVALVGVGVYLAFRFLLPLIWPFVIASSIAVILYPTLRRIMRYFGISNSKVKKWFLLFVVALFYIVLLILCSFLFRYLFRQSKSLFLNFPFYEAKMSGMLQGCCCRVDETLHVQNGVSYQYVSTFLDADWSKRAGSVMKKMTGYSMRMAQKAFSVGFSLLVMVIATFFVVQEYDEIRLQLIHSKIGRKVCGFVLKCKDTLKVYLKAQGLIFFCNGVVCVLALWIVGQPYFLILGLIVGLLDALPILGVGSFLIPYALFLVIEKKLNLALVLVVAYIICIFIRQTIEPKMIGKKVGMPPLFTIASMYVGVKLFGAFGFLLGPIGLMLAKEIYLLLNEKEQSVTKNNACTDNKIDI